MTCNLSTIFHKRYQVVNLFHNLNLYALEIENYFVRLAKWKSEWLEIFLCQYCKRSSLYQPVQYKWYNSSILAQQNDTSSKIYHKRVWLTRSFDFNSIPSTWERISCKQNKGKQNKLLCKNSSLHSKVRTTAALYHGKLLVISCHPNDHIFVFPAAEKLEPPCAAS